MGPRIIILIALLLPSAAMGAPSKESVAANPDLRLSWKTNVAGLIPGWPLLERAEGRAEVMLTASVDSGDVYRLFRVLAPTIFLAGTSLGGLTLELWEPPGADSFLRAEWSGAVGRVSMEATLRLDVDLTENTVALVPGPMNAVVQIESLDLGLVGGVLFGLPLSGILTGELRATGDSGNPNLEIELSVEEAAWRGVRLGALQTRILHASGQTGLHLRWGSEDDPVATLDAELPLDINLHEPSLTWRDADQHRISLVAGILDREKVHPFWAAPSGLDFHLGLVLDAAGSLDQFQGTATLAGIIEVDGDRIDIETRLDVDPTSQRIRVEVGDDELTVDLTAEIPLVSVRRSGRPMAAAPIRGTLTSNLPVGRIVPFLGASVDAATGQMTAAVEISGALGTPDLQGTVAVDNGAFRLLPIGRRLRGVTARAVLRGARLDIEELVALAAPGEIQGDGSLTWTITPPDATATTRLWSAWSLTGEVGLRLIELPMVRDGLPVALFTGGVELDLGASPGRRDVSIEVTQGAILLTDDDVPEAWAIPTNPAVRLVDWLADQVAVRHMEGHEVRRMALSLQRPIHVAGPGVEVDLEGRLSVERVGPRVRVEGGLDVIPGGRFDLFERRFELRAGRLTIAEGHLGRETGPREARPLEPVLDVVARGQVQRTHVLVRVAGPGRRPDLVLLSSPALPEFQIMTLLILGRVDVVNDRNGEVRRQIAKIIERYHSPDLKRQLFDSIGVDNLGLGFGESVASPILTVGKQVTRELYLETVYHHNAPPDTNNKEARVVYRWAPRWTTDTIFGDRGEGRLGVFWGTHFGGNPPPEAPAEDWGIVERDGPRPDRDNDGVMDTFDLCVDQPEDLDGDRDDDGCPEPDAPPRLPAGKVDLVGRLRTILFPLNSTTVPNEGKSLISTVLRLLEGLPAMALRIEGHSDHVGPKDLKQEISLQRAEVIRAALQRVGVPAEILSVEGVGDARPASSVLTEENRGLNRRVEVHLSLVNIHPGPAGNKIEEQR